MRRVPEHMSSFLRPVLHPSSMRARLLLQILPAVALAIAAVTLIAINRAASDERAAVYGEMEQLIAKEAARFDTQAQSNMTRAHTLAGTIEGDPDPSRARTAAITTELTKQSKGVLGEWAAF